MQNQYSKYVIQLGGGSSGDFPQSPEKPNWLIQFSKSQDVEELHIKTAVLDNPDYNRHRVLFDGRVLFETYEASFTHVEDLTNIPIGNHTLRVEYSLTSAGLSWDGAAYYEESFELSDIVPPTTVATFVAPDGNNGWHVNPVAVTLNATDNVGVASTYYRINQGDFVEGTSFTLSQDGIYTIEFYSIDVNGNAEEIKSTVILLDQTPPETTGTATGPRDINGLFRDNVQIDLTPTDNLSGVDHIDCSFDNMANWTMLPSPGFMLEGNGVYQFFCRTTDIAGNVEIEPLDSGPIIINMFLIYASSSSIDQALPAFSLSKTSNNTTLTGHIYAQGLVSLTNNTSATINGTVETGVNHYIDNGNVNSTFGTISLISNYVPAISYPFSYYWNRCDQVHPNGLVLDSVGVTIQGTVCVLGDLEIEAVHVTGDVTFVVFGRIFSRATASDFITSDIDNGMLMYAAGDVYLNDTGVNSFGLVYTPGTIYQFGTGNTKRGSYVANRVIIDKATGFVMSYDAGFAPATFALPVENMSFADPSESQGLAAPDPGQYIPPTETAVPTASPTSIPLPTTVPTNTVVPTSTPVPPTSPWNSGFVYNGSFEIVNNGVAQGWGSNGAVAVDGSSQGYHGTNSLHFTANGQYSNAYSWGFGIIPGQSYQVSVYIRSTPGTGNFGVKVDESNSSWQGISSQILGEISGNHNGVITATYTPSSSSVANVALQFYHNADATFEVFVDAVAFTLAPAPTPIPPPINPTASPTSIDLPTAVPTNTAGLAPTCSISFAWDGDDHVDAYFTWGNGSNQRHTIAWGDGDTDTTSRAASGSYSDDHRYDVDPSDGDPTLYTITLTVNGPGGVGSCQVVVDFTTNPEWIDEYN